MNNFDDIYSKYKTDVYRLAYSFVLNKEDAEDILQKTFYKLYKNQKVLKSEEEQIKKWLLKVSANECRDLLKTVWNKKVRNVEYKIINNVKEEQDKLKIIKSLENIEPKYRIILYLYYYQGYSVNEISTIIKKSESAVKMRLMRGKEMLRKEIGGFYE